MNAQLDHRVVVARTLDEGVQWCEATLGITPGAGGEPPRFGKHNRLFIDRSPAMQANFVGQQECQTALAV
jgi:hypothetical protein